MFKTFFLGYNKIWGGHKKLRWKCPRGYGPVDLQAFHVIISLVLAIWYLLLQHQRWDQCAQLSILEHMIKEKIWYRSFIFMKELRTIFKAMLLWYYTQWRYWIMCKKYCIMLFCGFQSAPSWWQQGVKYWTIVLVRLDTHATRWTNRPICNGEKMPFVLLENR